MKIGMLVRADRTGLAVQTYEFWRHIQPAKTLVIKPSWIHMDNFDASLYPGGMIMDSHPYPRESMVESPIIDEFLDGLDLVFTCETPYNFWLFKRAKERGVKTILQYNYEFLYALDPRNELPLPDLLLAPSLWNYNFKVATNKAFLPVPVNRAVLPYKKRTELNTILHTVGRQAAHDRNGTEMLMVAMSMLPQSVDVQLIVASQDHIPNLCPQRVKRKIGSVANYWDLYGDEDAFFMPRKFGGLCLPINEAASCGMPLVMTDVSPQNHFLDNESLLPAHKVKEFMAKIPIEIFETTPQDIARKIEEMYSNPELVQKMSEASNVYAESISWEVMLPKYLDLFESVVGG